MATDRGRIRGNMRKFLVLLDDSRECLNAIRFAAMRAARTEGRVVVLSVISPEEIQHGFGVADVMRAEARERIEAHYEVYAKWMRDRQGVEPELIIREGDAVEQMLSHLGEDPLISVIVLGLASDKAAQNPVVTRLLRDVSLLPVPITLVPADLDKDQLERVS